MPDFKLDASDAADLEEMLQFLSEWLARDPARLGTSLEQFVGHPAYDTEQLRQDLERFVFLLGGSDGESLFGLPPPCNTRLPGPPRIRRALRASTSFVLALARCGRSTLTPAAAPASSGSHPGKRRLIHQRGLRPVPGTPGRGNLRPCSPRASKPPSRTPSRWPDTMAHS
jgi:hypothetical protein